MPNEDTINEVLQRTAPDFERIIDEVTRFHVRTTSKNEPSPPLFPPTKEILATVAGYERLKTLSREELALIETKTRALIAAKKEEIVGLEFHLGKVTGLLTSGEIEGRT